MLHNIIEELEKMPEAEKQALLNTTFPEDMSKEAEAQVDTMGLAESLYNYGFMQGELAVAEVDGLDKIASEELQAHEAQMAQVGEDIDTFIENLAITEIEDGGELHKQAQAAAGIVFKGYTDAIEKRAEEAKEPGKMKKVLGKIVEKARVAGSHVKAHKGKYIGGAAGVAALGAGAHFARKHLKKEASETVTWGDLEAMESEEALQAVIAEGVEKLAADAVSSAAKLKALAQKGMAKVREGAAKGSELAKKHKGAIAAGAGAGGAGFLAGRMSKKD